MKTISCKQIGGACDTVFRVSSFDELTELTKKHAMEMLQKWDQPHMAAMNAMRELMSNPEAMRKWMQDKRAEFEALPDDQ